MTRPLQARLQLQEREVPGPGATRAELLECISDPVATRAELLECISDPVARQLYGWKLRKGKRLVRETFTKLEDWGGLIIPEHEPS